MKFLLHPVRLLHPDRLIDTTEYATEYFGKYPMKEIHLSFCFRLPQDQLTIDGAPNFRQVKLHLLKRWR